MAELELFQRLGLALAIGLLIGIERGWQVHIEGSANRIAGLRTFALIGMFGGICGWLTLILGPVVLGLSFVALSILIGISYWVGTQKYSEYGITSEIALLLVFALGAASVLGNMAAVAAVGVITAGLLASKSRLHGWVEQIQQLELNAAILLGLISVVLLPLLPNIGMGPGGVLNPYRIWLSVVMIAGISFVGYVAIRVTGPGRGALLGGMLGGLASSTATTLAFSRMARNTDKLAPTLAIGIVLAGSVTFLRILVVATALNVQIVSELALPILSMAAAGFVGALFLYLTNKPPTDTTPQIAGLVNPLELGSAIKFGALLAVVALATHQFGTWFGDAGIYIVAFISGFADVDAVTVSMSRMAASTGITEVAVNAIVIAASVNTIAKACISLAVGGIRVGRPVSLVYIVVLIVGALAVMSDVNINL